MEAGKRQPDRTRSSSNGVSPTAVTRMSDVAPLLFVGKYTTKNCFDSNPLLLVISAVLQREQERSQDQGW